MEKYDSFQNVKTQRVRHIPIHYDESGNPTSYKGATITRNGRLMTSYADSKGFKGIATIDEQVYNKYKKDFKRCSIEDNVNVFSWRYTYATENSKTLINMYSRKQKLKSIDFNENKNKNYKYTYIIRNKVVYVYYVELESYYQKLTLK